MQSSSGHPTPTPGWCDGGDIHQPHHATFFEKKRPKARKVRCPECNKYLTQQIRECEDEGCWHVKIPPHKAKR